MELSEFLLILDNIMMILLLLYCYGRMAEPYYQPRLRLGDLLCRDE